MLNLSIWLIYNYDRKCKRFCMHAKTDENSFCVFQPLKLKHNLFVANNIPKSNCKTTKADTG